MLIYAIECFVQSNEYAYCIQVKVKAENFKRARQIAKAHFKRKNETAMIKDMKLLWTER